ncbi:MAG: peptidoglycan DD-metalloendopeptidase family protein [Bacteroidales bacterium]|jgi:murein DD-endopeptidase MepM/ murein hydrolase activator NlpD|nr:peptidoglycan DD-metalloendopeptidase family protein [Bacteroidales bacterium]
MSKWFKNFKDKFKVVIIHPVTLEEKLGFDMSKMSLTAMIVVYSLLLIIITTVLIFFTPLRELIPGYTDVTLNRRVYNIERRADSLEAELNRNDVYIQNLKHILSSDEEYDATTDNTLINIRKNRESKAAAANGKSVEYNYVALLPPLNGMITSHFDSKNSHYGVDIVAETDAVIKATADGTVIFSDWSAEGGYVIGIQHDRNTISIYKHNASLLHHEGDLVKAGEGIAIIGGGGTTSTGPHLHFELWFRGMALDPEDFISFESK